MACKDAHKDCILQVYQEHAKELSEAGDEESRLHALHKWIQAAEQSGDQAALAQAHMQMGLAHQQQVCSSRCKASDLVLCLGVRMDYISVHAMQQQGETCNMPNCCVTQPAATFLQA